jgi:peptidoglycan/xylan/chitin deacetylase (PgdA/CDA1 family)
MPLSALHAGENLEPQFQKPAKGVEANLKPIPFADLAPDGLLKARAELSLRRLQEPYFQWDNVSRVNFGPFPGDALGRTINGLTLLSQALNQPEPASLKEIIRRVPSLANPDGYLGPKLPESRANEDTMAGHNGYAYGLMEYALWTKDPETKESLRRMVANLFVPARAAIAGYRETSEAKVDWHLSGGDVGQLFTALDGMTRAYALVPSPEFKATIETAIERYRKLDLVGLSAQTHAMLSAATGILRWYEMHHRPGDLAFAEALYKQYRALAMTETFENYNWFNKPKWTEACGVIDSFILTVNLWRLTGRADYLEDAHLILFNGLLPGQLHNGGFGTGPCVGHATGACRTKMHSEAPFCCSMRGGEGIARAIQYSYFQDKDTVVLPFYSNGMATLRFVEGTCKVRQETGYPHQGQVRLEIMESQINKEKTWRFFVPSWAVKDSFEIRVNGKKAEPRLVDSFAEIAVRPVAGTIIEVAFQQKRGRRPAVQSSQAPGASQYFSGPLLLGSATDHAAEPLVPILDLLGPGGRGGEPCVYFPNGKPQPAANAAAARKAPNLADTAQVFRRDMPPDRVPAEVGKLFATLKQDRNLAICGFVWPSPQKVRQVVLQWPESGAMPKPEAIVLRWSAAGEVHTAAQPGIIGNGRQWIYTLGKAPEGAAVDGLVLAGKSAKEIPDAIAVPSIEIPSKLVVLTFDDSVASQATFVAPLLKSLGFGATFFITEGFDFATNKTQYMTWEQIKQLHGQGFEIGNHTRHHKSVNQQSVAELTADITYIEDQCEKNGIPRPVTFCYPGHATSQEAVNVLKARGYKCARAGGSRVFELGKDDPLLMPQAFSSYPGMTIEELKVAVANAREGSIAVLTFHGVPDVQHPSASTDQETFKAYMNYLKAEGCTVVALRDIIKYLP